MYISALTFSLPSSSAKRLGQRCLDAIASSFSRTFYRNAINSGLPIIECPELYNLVSEGDEIEIDLAGTIQHLGRSIPFPTFPDSVRELLELGGLAEYLKAQHGKFHTP